MFNGQNGPLPMHDVVVSAVAAAVMAATITFNSTSQNRELFIALIIFNYSGAWGKEQENRLCASVNQYPGNKLTSCPMHLAPLPLESGD